MTPGWQELVYGAALVLFALAFLVDVFRPISRLSPVSLVALGLALVTLVPLWNAAALR